MGDMTTVLDPEAARRASATAEHTATEARGNVEGMANQIRPFATALMNLGIDPQSFMSSPLGQSILNQQLQGISGPYQGARNNLAESLGQSGMTGSGVGVGPLANMLQGEAGAVSNVYSQLPMTGLQLGMQGAGMLHQQQQVESPLGYLQAAIGGFGGQNQNAFLNALGQALGGSLGTIYPGNLFGGLGGIFGGGGLGGNYPGGPGGGGDWGYPGANNPYVPGYPGAPNPNEPFGPPSQYGGPFTN